MTWFVAAVATMVSLSLAGQARAQSTGPRVAVVNIGVVFTKYQKAIDFKKEMEATLKPFKDKAELIKKDIMAYQQGAADPKTEPKLREQYQNAVIAKKRELEDLDMAARKAIGSKQETHLVQLFKDVAAHIQAVSAANGIHLVLGFGEPPDGDLYSFANINRKLTGMDMGASLPLYFHSSLDISETVVASLNRGSGLNVTPTGGGGQR